MCGRPDNRVAFSGCFLNNQTGDYCTEAAHLQHMRPPGAQYRNSPFPPSPNSCNWCNCSFCFKCLARAYILEADCALIKEAQGWDSHKKNQSKMLSCLLIQALSPAMCRCCQKTSICKFSRCSPKVMEIQGITLCSTTQAQTWGKSLGVSLPSQGTVTKVVYWVLCIQIKSHLPLLLKGQDYQRLTDEGELSEIKTTWHTSELNVQQVPPYPWQVSSSQF